MSFISLGWKFSDHGNAYLGKLRCGHCAVACRCGGRGTLGRQPHGCIVHCVARFQAILVPMRHKPDINNNPNFPSRFLVTYLWKSGQPKSEDKGRNRGSNFIYRWYYKLTLPPRAPGLWISCVATLTRAAIWTNTRVETCWRGYCACQSLNEICIFCTPQCPMLHYHAK